MTGRGIAALIPALFGDARPGHRRRSGRPGPAAAETSALAARLGHTSPAAADRLSGRPAHAAAPFVIAAAPLLAADAVVAGLVAGLDLSCSASSRPTTWYPGEPAAWYILAQWVWPDAPGQPVAT